MIRALVEVKDENSAFSIEVYAENLRRAAEFAANRYPGRAVSVLFPLDPEVFFVEGSATWWQTVESAAAKGSQHERGLDDAAGAPVAR